MFPKINPLRYDEFFATETQKWEQDTGNREERTIPFSKSIVKQNNTFKHIPPYIILFCAFTAQLQSISLHIWAFSYMLG